MESGSEASEASCEQTTLAEGGVVQGPVAAENVEAAPFPEACALPPSRLLPTARWRHTASWLPATV